MADGSTRPLVIAVDGPAASGKGTIARALAARFGLPHMDTGLLYRAVGLAVLRAGQPPEDPAAAAAVAAGGRFDFGDPALRSDLAAAAASVVSAHPPVRAALLASQRAFADQPGGAVLDGRDIGTVIAPAATAKLFVTADPMVRARRRHLEHPDRPFGAVLDDILARDARDRARAASPLAAATDADLLDTSAVDIEEAVRQALALVEARIAGVGAFTRPLVARAEA